MNIERVNSTLVRAIDRVQAGELEGMVEAFSVPTPSEMHAKYGMVLPVTMHGLPEGSKDETKESLEQSLYNWKRYGHSGKMGGDITAAKRGKLNKSQKKVMQMVGKELDLPFISNVLLFADEFRHLKKNERKAVLALVMGGVLKLYRVPGPLPGVHRPSKVGANANNHYRLVPA